MNDWIKKTEADRGRRAGISTEMAEKIKALERENRELRQANEILRKGEPLRRHWFKPTGERVFCDDRGQSGTASSIAADVRPPVEVMVSFIDAHRALANPNKNGAAWWLEVRDYNKDEFREAWHRLVPNPPVEPSHGG